MPCPASVKCRLLVHSADLPSLGRFAVIAVASTQKAGDNRGNGHSKTHTEGEKECGDQEAKNYIHEAFSNSCPEKAAAEPAALPLTMAVDTKGVSECVMSPEQPDQVAARVRS